jgi:hypothetical protein
MPYLEKILTESTFFTKNHITVPRTFPSLVDIMTGKHGMTHGVRHMFPTKEKRNRIGSTGFPTFTQILQSQGYRTGVISDFAGDVFSRANWGFDDVEVPFLSFKTLLEAKSIETSFLILPYLSNYFGREVYPIVKGFPQLGDPELLKPHVENFLSEYKNLSQFFLMVFLSPAHFPYSPPYPYYKEFADPEYKGNFRYLKYVDVYQKETVTEKDKQELNALFDGALRSCDDFVRWIFEELKKQELDENTIVIIFGDHGEALYEADHGQGHGDHLWGPNIIMSPLIFHFPPSLRKIYPSGIISEISSTIDLAPTILGLTDISYPTEFHGRDLGYLLKNPGKKTKKLLGAKRIVYSETGVWYTNSGGQKFQKMRIIYPNIDTLGTIEPDTNYEMAIINPFHEALINISKHRTVTDGKYKLIYIPTRKKIIYELYNIKKDPLNKKNIYAPQHPVFVRLKKYLDNYVKKHEKVKIINGYYIPKNLLK